MNIEDLLKDMDNPDRFISDAVLCIGKLVHVSMPHERLVETVFVGLGDDGHGSLHAYCRRAGSIVVESVHYSRVKELYHE